MSPTCSIPRTQDSPSNKNLSRLLLSRTRPSVDFPPVLSVHWPSISHRGQQRSEAMALVVEFEMRRSEQGLPAPKEERPAGHHSAARFPRAVVPPPTLNPSPDGHRCRGWGSGEGQTRRCRNQRPSPRLLRLRERGLRSDTLSPALIRRPRPTFDRFLAATPCPRHNGLVPQREGRRRA